MLLLASMCVIVCVCNYIYVMLFTHMYTPGGMYTYIFIYLYISVYIYICIYPYIYRYIQRETEREQKRNRKRKREKKRRSGNVLHQRAGLDYMISGGKPTRPLAVYDCCRTALFGWQQGPFLRAARVANDVAPLKPQKNEAGRRRHSQKYKQTLSLPLSIDM